MRNGVFQKRVEEVRIRSVGVCRNKRKQVGQKSSRRVQGKKNEEDVSAASNSNADNGYERGSLMDGRTRDENETGWIDLLNVTFSISRPNVASVVGRP